MPDLHSSGNPHMRPAARWVPALEGPKADLMTTALQCNAERPARKALLVPRAFDDL